MVRYGMHTRHQHACRETFLRYGATIGIGPRQLAHNINFFMNVPLYRRRWPDVRGRPVRAGQVRRDARRARPVRTDQQLPAAQQPLQRLGSHPGPAAGLVVMTVTESPGAARPHRDASPCSHLECRPACRTSQGVAACGTSACRRPARGTTCPSPWPTRPSATRPERPGWRPWSPARSCGSTGAPLVCLTGAATEATVDGRPLRPGVVTSVAAGSTVDVGRCGGPGMRGVPGRRRAGCWCRVCLGSRATFLLGGFGGLDGRALADGRRAAGSVEPRTSGFPSTSPPCCPALGTDWTVRVLAGPHGAPEHLTDGGRRPPCSPRPGRSTTAPTAPASAWSGPAPRWARQRRRRGRAAPVEHPRQRVPGRRHHAVRRHPGRSSDRTDRASVGSWCRAVVIRADRWMLAQARPGDTVRLALVSPSRPTRRTPSGPRCSPIRVPPWPPVCDGHR